MDSVSDVLLETLEGLEKESFKSFKRKLGQDVGQFPRIAKCKLEDKDRSDVVDQMVETYGQNKAVDVTILVLQKIRQNQLAEDLTERKERGKTTESVLFRPL